LNTELGLPVYIFTDGDPWGMHIAMVICSGSASAAHIPNLATPDAEWIGIWASDIRRYRLPTEPFNKRDLKRLEELRRDPRYKRGRWKRELELFASLRRKAEQEALNKYGLSYVVDKYLPDKLGL